MRPKKDLRRKDRWGSIEDVVDDAMQEMEQKQKDLERFWRDCRRWNPDFFGTMSLEAFERWNDQRLARLDDDAPEQTYAQAKAEFVANVADTTWPEGHDWRNGAP